MNKRKQVFFLGAGFSKAINPAYPLMNELCTDILGQLELETDTISAHYKTEIPENIKNNIEHLLTYLSTDFPWKQENNYTDRALYERISRMIGQHFQQLDKNGEHSNNDLFNRLIAGFLENPHCDIITLNYDVLIERAMEKYVKNNGQPYLPWERLYPYPLSWIGSRTIPDIGTWRGTSFTQRLPSIIKLHGSVNWYHAGASSSDTIYYRNDNSNETEHMTVGLVPYIIPPVMDKNAFYHHIAIRHLWQAAAHLLNEADDVFIIGFSFPPTDTAVRFLFQTALNPQADVHIVDISDENTLKEHHKGLFGHRQVSYRYCGNTPVPPLERFIDENLPIPTTQATGAAQ